MVTDRIVRFASRMASRNTTAVSIVLRTRSGAITLAPVPGSAAQAMSTARKWAEDGWACWVQGINYNGEFIPLTEQGTIQ